MGSVKKKLDKVMNKVADKLIPKEIAPLLPIASMFIPGMQGLSPLMRYGLPQLLTGLGSAKRTGKINPLAQAMTALASYSAGPGPQGATGKEGQFFEEMTDVSDIGYGEGMVDPGLAKAAEYGGTNILSESGKGLKLAQDPVAFAAKNKDAFKGFDFVKPEG